ncbi:hypothetical protein [Seohaeicola zhoushanensis]|uniref:Uncharacterized protein n=1 Tax=Seohaeicola zhoushanensis TaxID=1569283 RepID=A0A8J3M425_9RHOB|nr:hypothetical protein [Seohaeicola zhoushanensis]GHF33235.1 hypothetical protein GCM10017056_00810 [Seohaeicola zhoushanensis]
MIRAQPFDDLNGMAVLSRLDPSDLVEASLVRGASVSHLALFAEWRSMVPVSVLNLVLHDHSRAGQPFAVLALVNTGQAGVASAALLARSHRVHRRALAHAALQIRDDMPKFCAERGIHRIEARSWRDHPTAARFLRACGFRHETDMPGFGADGAVTFSQFAWTHHQPKE